MEWMAGVAEHSFEICGAGQSQTASFVQLEAYALLLESLTCEIDESPLNRGQQKLANDDMNQLLYHEKSNKLSQRHIDDNVCDSAVPISAGSSTCLSFSIVVVEFVDELWCFRARCAELRKGRECFLSFIVLLKVTIWLLVVHCCVAER